MDRIPGNWRPRLIVSDLDGTLINSNERISPRLFRVLATLSKDIPLVLATGRPMRWVLPIVQQLPVQPLCICGNGSVVYDSAQDRVLQSDMLAAPSVATVMRIAEEVFADFGAVGFAVERAGKDAFDTSQGALFAVNSDYFHVWESDEHTLETNQQLAAHKVVKLLIRHAELDSARMYELLAPHIDPELAHLTYSMSDGLLEATAPNANKGAALRQLAPSLGVDAADILAFGDMPNDIEMLRWAGYSVAMANAAEAVQAVATEITASHNEDGVAVVLERFL